MNKEINVLDIYDQAVKEWDDFNEKRKFCSQLLDGQDAVKELAEIYPQEFWKGKDYYVRWKLDQHFV